ncbi:sensor histidine kinase [Ruminococcus flavefaciens]|uniref:HAMP domain-containing sensor histidine kinase n=1 Tax=Ruminococcus flavefaciens TaxID=1265 RepID=UPI0026EB09B8|nr:HAMP domain-containing sensor histidine kinase [Ruminococcus flavefaciens]MDD7517349.1 HAMP domain-containing sensor histidine kinase [Ruminococcus flavefaciens]MDY5690880.1 HAMP domain-containing sensor histidine kinase [Ruminococcus flavefaciens]
MAKKSITKRWIFNNLGVVVLALLVIDMAIVYAIQNYFYSSAKQYLVSKINAVTSVLSIHSQDSSTNFSSEMRNMLETFNEKDKIELMAINSKGRVVLTSSGFSPDADDVMPDYVKAMESGEGSHVYKLGGGEKVLAVTMPISSMSGEYSAVRMVTSLTAIDNTIKTYTAAVTLVCVVIILIIVVTGLYFAGSIVRPIRQISGIARKYAMGDFSTRIDNDSDDEIGDLCTTINNMADELSNAEAMKNEFISSVSHELRTPLTAIKGWAETLMIDGGGSPDTMKKGVRVIVNETERLSQMVEELLDFSRMQNGHFTLQNANMDILAELGDAVLIYSEKARREDKKIIYDEPEMLPFVFGDKNRIRQVFINVIDNAVKYSSEGDTVTIKAYESGENVIVSVSDTGLGIKASDLAKVKTKFYKANHTRRGSGIGLAVADEIISMHGGKLDIDSEGEGKGTTVTITLPAVKP